MKSFLFLFLFISQVSWSATEVAENDEVYFKISDIRVKEVPVSEESLFLMQAWRSMQETPIGIPRLPQTPKPPQPSPQEPGLGEIFNVGLKVWDFIKKNEPVVNLSLPRASALPVGLRDWSEMENWSSNQLREYEVRYVNGYGSEVVTIRVLLTYSYGGSYNGRGQYLSEVGILAKNVDVSWGFTVDAKAEVARIVNAGTRENPQALMELNMIWNIRNIIQNKTESVHFSIRGNGEVKAY